VARAQGVSSQVRDLTEVLTQAPRALRFRPSSDELVVYQDACHLQHGQGIVEEPRRLLRAAGARLVEPEEADLCCGSAGSYNLARDEMGARLGRRKAAALVATGARWVVTANPGCAIQLQAHLPRRGPTVVSLARFLADRLADGE